MSDQQTQIFSSRFGTNYLEYSFILEKDLKLMPKIVSDMERFRENVLKHFKYDHIPKLRCEILSYHINNLWVEVHQLLHMYPVNTLIRRVGLGSQYQCLGRGNPSEEPTEEQNLVKIDLVYKISREIRHFHAFAF